MKKLSPYRIPLFGILFVLVVTIGINGLMIGAQKKEARVTQIIKDVRLLPAGTSPRPASVNDYVSTGTAVRTGSDSRTELTFADQSLTRLGANSVFSFGEGAKTFDLASGALLICVPKQSVTTQVKIGAVTAAVSGFTAMFEHHAKTWSKFIVLHGKGTATFRGRDDACELNAGQMIAWLPNQKKCPPVLNIDISKLFAGKLIKGFPPLPEHDLILAEIEKQKESPPPGGYTDPTNIDALDQNDAARPPEHSATPIPIPSITPSAFN